MSAARISSSGATPGMQPRYSIVQPQDCLTEAVARSLLKECFEQMRADLVADIRQEMVAVLKEFTHFQSGCMQEVTNCGSGLRRLWSSPSEWRFQGRKFGFAFESCDTPPGSASAAGSASIGLHRAAGSRSEGAPNAEPGQLLLGSEGPKAAELPAPPQRSSEGAGAPRELEQALSAADAGPGRQGGPPADAAAAATMAVLRQGPSPRAPEHRASWSRPCRLEARPAAATMAVLRQGPSPRPSIVQGAPSSTGAGGSYVALAPGGGARIRVSSISVRNDPRQEQRKRTSLQEPVEPSRRPEERKASAGERTEARRLSDFLGEGNWDTVTADAHADNVTAAPGAVTTALSPAPVTLDAPGATAQARLPPRPSFQSVAGPMPGLLGLTVWNFQKAVDLRSSGGSLEDLQEVRRTPFLEGVESFAKALNHLGGSMGDHLLTNTKKCRGSQADQNEEDFRAWLLSELPVHKATQYKSYVDNSAWMANLWIGRILEFFVELFALIEQGNETKASFDQAYKRTLYNHHNMIQRGGFNQAKNRLPKREKMLESLRGDAGPSVKQADLLKQVADFVIVGRPIVRYCLKMNEELDERLQQQRRASATGR